MINPKKQIPIVNSSSVGTAPQNGNPTILNYRVVPGWLMPNDGPLGHTNGGIAVRANGEIYVTHRLPMAGIAVYAPDGTHLRNVSNAPRNLHTILIRTGPEGEVLYAVRGGGAADTGPYSGSVATGPIIEKMTLEGKVLWSISASAIPDKFKDTELNKSKSLNDRKDGARVVRMSGLAVAPNGDLYASDGYAPHGFNRLHNLAIDTRFTPVRIIGTDQRNNRLVHWSLDGEFLGVFASDLRTPKDVVIYGDYIVVAEARGRMAVLDKAGRIVTTSARTP